LNDVFVDSDEVLQNFDDVEERVNKVIALCRTLSREKAELKEKVSQLEEQLLKKAEIEEQYRKQKIQVRSKIDSLLVKLNELDGLGDIGQ
jgi:cell division septum initiation protein DivIVA